MQVYKSKHNFTGELFDLIQEFQGHARKDLLEVLLESIPLAVVITNREGKIEYVNKQFETITGYMFHEIYLKNPSILKEK